MSLPRIPAAVALLLASLLAAPLRADRTPTPAEWHAAQMKAVDQSERIMREATAKKGLLAQYEVMLNAAYEHSREPAFQIIFGQYLSWFQTYVGDYPDAEDSFTVAEPLQPGDHPPPLADSAYHARPALTAIAELAKGRRAVFFNEAHNLPMTRTLTVQMLAALRKQGFTWFAAETLYHTDTALQARGYPIEATGFYTNEPICAEMVRTALKLGFKVVAYEAETDGPSDSREKEQAQHLADRVFKQDPKARLVVDAGYAHIQETGVYLGGRSMAEYFTRFTGIDPLTVEQTMLIPHRKAGYDHPYYTAVVQALHPVAPTVFVSADGTPWVLRDGYDVSVLFPPVQMRRGRPTWLELGGLRQPYLVNGDAGCKHTYPCLVEARYADEGADAIPADRVLFDPRPELTLDRADHARPMNGAASGELYLRPGDYVLGMTDADGRTLSRQTISVARP